MLYTGCVESRDDPLKLGRCQVRIVGVHTDDKAMLPTDQLPWAYPMQPVTSAAMNGIGWTPVGAVLGTWVVIMFRDDELQQPVMIGTIGGIPQSKAAERIVDNSDSLATDGGVISDALGNATKNADGSDKTIDAGIKGIIAGATNTLLGAIGNLLGINIGGNAKADQLEVPSIGASDDSQPTITPKIESSEDAVISSQPVVGKADSKVIATPIKTDPPPKYASGDIGKKRQSIQALIAACNQLGYTSKYAQASILGICGGESNWLPVEEGHRYSSGRLMKVWPSIFSANPDLATQYAYMDSKAEFFRFIYGPTTGPGKSLGHKLPNDGALFYGRGFNQLTGRPNYEAVERGLKKLGIIAPISTNPALLLDDINISALATVMFYKQRIGSIEQDSPSFFEAAKKATGGSQTSWEKKKICYEYFLGQGVLPESTNKEPVDETKVYTKAEVSYLPEQKQLALLEDRSDATTLGFRDPKGKYPLRNLMDEPDTNRLSRGVIKDTAVAYKDATRTIGIKAANDGADWEQPLAPFGGQYPYSKVYETESGHLMTYDDTPGHENIGTYHRKGTFTDIDSNGTQVNKIVGDGYTVIDRNGFLYISGKCNITVGNSANILVQGNADIEVNGVTQANFHSDVNLGCAQDVNWAIGGDFNLKVDGKFNTTVMSDASTSIVGNDSTQVNGNISTITSANMSTQVAGDFAHKTDGSATIQSTGNLSLKSGADIINQAGSTFNAKSSGAMNMNAGANFNVDGAEFHGQQGSSSGAPDIEDVAVLEAFAALSLAPPEIRSSSGDLFSVLQTPVRPAPPVDIKSELLSTNNAAIEDFKSNPSKYYNSAAEAGGVNPERPPQPDIGDNGQSMISGAAAGDIQEFLKEQLTKAKEGYWSETGMKGGSSNPNILAIWKDLGLASIGTSDQVAWCAAFVNWVLKQCNYRYARSARAFDIRDKTDKWKMTKVTDPQPGDITVWSYSHVNFVYEVLSNGNLTFCGGNQGGGKVSDNNPKGGSVTVSYANGTSKSNSSIIGFYRPSKA